MNYEKDIKIDAENLDKEWLNQPSLMRKYTKHQAETERDMQQQKEKMELEIAELDKKIRKNPEKFELEGKITEKVITNTILMQGSYQETHERYLDAKYEYEVAKGTVQAFQHRKNALENLVTLFGQQYFAGPSAPLNISREWEKQQTHEKAKSKIKSRIKPKRKIKQ